MGPVPHHASALHQVGLRRRLTLLSLPAVASVGEGAMFAPVCVSDLLDYEPNAAVPLSAQYAAEICKFRFGS